MPDQDAGHSTFPKPFSYLGVPFLIHSDESWPFADILVEIMVRSMTHVITFGM
jgi:hypothetical protein